MTLDVFPVSVTVLMVDNLSPATINELTILAILSTVFEM